MLLCHTVMTCSDWSLVCSRSQLWRSGWLLKWSMWRLRILSGSVIRYTGHFVVTPSKFAQIDGCKQLPIDNHPMFSWVTPYAKIFCIHQRQCGGGGYSHAFLKITEKPPMIVYVLSAAGYLCTCLEGWSGENCTIEDECITEEVTCQNNATCHDNATASWHCACAEK